VEEAAEKEELAEVVGVVVEEEDGFGGEGLVVGVGDGSEEIGFFEGGEEFFAVGAQGSHGFVPSVGVGRFGRLGPVAVGEIGRFVFGIEGVLDDVPLGDAEMFDELPCGVGKIVGARATKIRGKVFDDGVEAGMGVLFGEVGDEFVAEGDAG
jgi:hypothetical protein